MLTALYFLVYSSGERAIKIAPTFFAILCVCFFGSPKDAVHYKSPFIKGAVSEADWWFLEYFSGARTTTGRPYMFAIYSCWADTGPAPTTVKRSLSI